MNNTNQELLSHEKSVRDIASIEKPAVSVQVLIFSINKGKFEMVLIKRIRDPFKGFWSIPGDIISIGESLETAAKRILYEKTGIKDVFLAQLYSFGEVDRDPRGRVIAVTYYALLPHNSVDLSKAPDALHARWTSIVDMPELAFDHQDIITYATQRVKTKLNYSTIARAFLLEKFRLFELQRVHEIILGQMLDKRNFRKKMQSLKIVEPTGEIYKLGNHRPASLYKFSNTDIINFD